MCWQILKLAGRYGQVIMGQLWVRGKRRKLLQKEMDTGCLIPFRMAARGMWGVILPGVTSDGKENTAVVNSWWKYAGNYQSWSNVPLVRTNCIFTNSWGKLREVALTYRVRNALISKTNIFQTLSFSVVGRDLFYLFTNLPDKLNPEGLSSSGNIQGIQFGQLPGVRSIGFSVKAGF